MRVAVMKRMRMPRRCSTDAGLREPAQLEFGPGLSLTVRPPTSPCMITLAPLPRAVVEVSGEDHVSFLQGLVSNDVAEAAPGRAVWAALLTPQGKWLADFFILADGGRLLLDCEAGQAAMLVQRLTRFRLRAKVAVQLVALQVHAGWGGAAPEAGITAPDPRTPDAGWRVLSDVPLPVNATAEEWDRHRLALGLPDGSRDMESECRGPKAATWARS